MLHGIVDGKVKIGAMALEMLKQDIMDVVMDYSVLNNTGHVTTLRGAADEIVDCFERRILGDINFGGF